MSGIDDPEWREANPGTMARLLAEQFVELPPGDDRRPLYSHIVSWLYASYIEDGYSEAEIDEMDVESAADELIRRAGR
jgi:hypothetical protein